MSATRKPLIDPVLGPLTFDEGLGYVSEPKPVGILEQRLCQFVLDIDESGASEDVHRAIQNALGGSPDVLKRAEPFLVAYCEDMLRLYDGDEKPEVKLDKPSDVWSYVDVGDTFTVYRRQDGDSEDGVYLSIEGSCDWEEEHGLQMVFRNGTELTKLGSFDGHCTNSDAFGDPELQGVVYVPVPRR